MDNDELAGHFARMSVRNQVQPIIRALLELLGEHVQASRNADDARVRPPPFAILLACHYTEEEIETRALKPVDSQLFLALKNEFVATLEPLVLCCHSDGGPHQFSIAASTRTGDVLKAYAWHVNDHSVLREHYRNVVEHDRERYGYDRKYRNWAIVVRRRSYLEDVEWWTGCVANKDRTVARVFRDQMRSGGGST